MRRNGRYLEDAAPELQNNKKVVLAAVLNDGAALQWASERLKNDRDIVLAAARNSRAALRYAAPELRRDKVMTTVSHHPRFKRPRSATPTSECEY